MVALPAALQRPVYKAQQRGMLLNCLVAQRVLRLLARRAITPDREAQRTVQARYEALLERDLSNVEAGLYPAELLFQFPFREYISRAPAMALDLPRTIRRMWRGDYKDLPEDVDLKRYPPYFRRNFHWQTDGYLSRRSAEIYDLGVELLFLGTADVMRRQIIPPITRFVREQGGARGLKLLDVATGTGRALKQLALAHPELAFYGLDLSPYYLQKARELLAGVDNLSLVAENAEQMPFKDATFDLVTSVHLFHELPPNARRNVYAEMWRVLRPGGMLVIQDSGQLSEAGPVAFFLGKFSQEFHEPFHRKYLEDPIEEGLAAQGFEIESVEPHFVAKVVVAHKPGAPAP